MEKFDLALAGQRVYDLIWNEYCDWYIEIVKGRLYGEDEQDKKVARRILVEVLKDMLRLLHPFMPFITEEIWGFLPQEGESPKNPDNFLIKDKWPIYREELKYEKEAAHLEMAKEVIRAIRNIRAEAEAAPGKKLTAIIVAEGEAKESCLAAERYIKKLANITSLEVTEETGELPREVMSAVISGAEIFIPLDDLLDYDAERERLKKEHKKLIGEVQRCEKMLSNPGFVNKAPAAKIRQEEEKLENYKEMLAKVEERMSMVEKKLS